MNLYKLIILLSLVLCGITRGISEGMVMQYEGIRGHRWFEYYHLIDFTSYLLTIFFTASIVLFAKDFWRWQGAILLIGSGLWSWQGFETAYAFTRFNVILPEQENVFGLGLYARYRQVLILTAVRVIGGLTLIGIGVICI